MHIPPFDNDNKPIIDIENNIVPNIYFNTVNSIVIEDVLRADELIYSDASFKKCFNQKDRTFIINSTVKEMINICLDII